MALTSMKVRNDDEIVKICNYCELASELKTIDKMVCKKRGIVSKDYSCSKFSYDPLKRNPARKEIQKIEKEDFPAIPDDDGLSEEKSNSFC